MGVIDKQIDDDRCSPLVICGKRKVGMRRVRPNSPVRVNGALLTDVGDPKTIEAWKGDEAAMGR